MLTKAILRVTLGLTLSTAATPGASAMQTISGASCDGTTCPRPLELVNGEPVTIVLSGLRLDGLVSGTVTDGRRAISGITVELASLSRLRAIATTNRNVRITAEGVGALTGLQLRFTTSAGSSVVAPLDLSVAEVTTAPGTLAPTDPSLPTRTRPTTAIQTRVSSASPQIVDVQPGSSVTVTVQGAYLDLLRSARVARNGTSMSHLTAELLSGGTSTSRDVRLTAPQGVDGPWNVPLELLLTDRTGGSHTVPVELYVAMPDLVVENLRPHVGAAWGVPPGSGNPWVLGRDKIAYTYDLANRGRAVAAFPVGVTAHRLASPPFPSKSTDYSWVYDVPPSGSPVQIEIYQWEAYETADVQPGTYTWVLTVDPDNLIPESNESNNQVSVQVRLEEPSADLAITNIAIDPPSPTEVDDIRFHVTIENLGNTPANPIMQSPDCNVFSSVRIGGTGTSQLLAGGETRVLSIRTDGGVQFMPGTHTCTFSVAAEDLQDTDSNNNEQTYTYTITGSDPPPPDFVITSVKTDPAVPKANTEYVLVATIRNEGPGVHFWNAAEVRVESTNCLVDPLGLGVTYSIGSVGGTPRVSVNQYEPEITFSVGESNDFVMKATPALMLPAGPRDCTFVVLTDGPEGDESNNRFRFTWGLIP